MNDLIKADDSMELNRPLPPDIPWQVRRRIRQLERETDRLYSWMYRIGLIMEILIAVMLFVCMVDFQIR